MSKFEFKHGQLGFNESENGEITVEEAQVLATMKLIEKLDEIKFKLSGIEHIIARK